MTDADQLRDRMVDALVAHGHLVSGRWRRAFRAVPREHFVDRFVVPTRDGRHTEHDLSDPRGHAAALAAVYSDATLITRWDRGGTAVCSSTAPSLMAKMVERLDVRSGHAVLEIGTGTGYQTAILCHALGAPRVTTTEIDPIQAERARRSLHALAVRPTILTADGTLGAPDRAPFDRLIATCGLDRVPAAWLPQLREGGLLVANVGFGLVRLSVHNGTATGPFLAPAAFTPLRRNTTEPAPTAHDARAMVREDAAPTRTHFPGDLLTDTMIFLRRLVFPEIIWAASNHDGLRWTLADPTTASWSVTIRQSPTVAEVRTNGPRALWSDLLDLHMTWLHAGRPSLNRLGLTIHPDGTHDLWVDAPGRLFRRL